uniref:Putative secreted protein n=1 Tax=Anopheles darlingi TaxID=43151 RepID=A0A2M4DEA7_ANODA
MVGVLLLAWFLLVVIVNGRERLWCYRRADYRNPGLFVVILWNRLHQHIRRLMACRLALLILNNARCDRRVSLDDVRRELLLLM